MSWTAKHLEQVRATVIVVGGRICRDRGWDVEDLVSDVTLLLLRREHTASRYDAQRGSVDVYLRRVTRSVVGHWLDRERARKRDVRAIPADPEPMTPDEFGVDDAQRAALVAVLDDARRVVGETAYRVVVAALLGDDLVAVAHRAGLALDSVWRYVLLTLVRLEKGADACWRPVWARHRLRVYRQLRRAASGLPATTSRS